MFGNDIKFGHLDNEDCPCKCCKERHAGCHDDCKKYLVWRKKIDDENKEIAKKKFLDNITVTKRKK